MKALKSELAKIVLANPDARRQLRAALAKRSVESNVMAPVITVPVRDGKRLRLTVRVVPKPG